MSSTDTIMEFNHKGIYVVWCDVLGNDVATEMNARATLSNDRQ
jgi:hypothetical protein